MTMRLAPSITPDTQFYWDDLVLAQFQPAAQQ
jgi:hypothetical protein